MKLYHGSNTIVTHPNHTLGNPYKDFGPGFYAVDTLPAAWDFAKANCARSEHSKCTGFVNTYEYISKDKLVVKEFDRYDAEWLDAVTMIKCFGAPGLKGYDIVVGPCPDEYSCTLLNRYWRGDFGLVGSAAAVRTILKELPPTNYGKQYCFRTKKALSSLKWESAHMPHADREEVVASEEAVRQTVARMMCITEGEVQRYLPDDPCQRMWMEGPMYVKEYITSKEK